MGHSASISPTSVTVYNYDYIGNKEQTFNFSWTAASGSSSAGGDGSWLQSIEDDFSYASTNGGATLCDIDGDTIEVGASLQDKEPRLKLIIGSGFWAYGTRTYTFYSYHYQWHHLKKKRHSGTFTLTVTFADPVSTYVTVSTTSVFSQKTSLSFLINAKASIISSIQQCINSGGVTIAAPSGIESITLSDYSCTYDSSTQLSVYLTIERNELEEIRLGRVFFTIISDEPFVTFLQMANVSDDYFYITKSSSAVELLNASTGLTLTSFDGTTSSLAYTFNSEVSATTSGVQLSLSFGTSSTVKVKATLISGNSLSYSENTVTAVSKGLSDVYMYRLEDGEEANGWKETRVFYYTSLTTTVLHAYVGRYISSPLVSISSEYYVSDDDEPTRFSVVSRDYDYIECNAINKTVCDGSQIYFKANYASETAKISETGNIESITIDYVGTDSSGAVIRLNMPTGTLSSIYPIIVRKESELLTLTKDKSYTSYLPATGDGTQMTYDGYHRLIIYFKSGARVYVYLHFEKPYGLSIKQASNGDSVVGFTESKYNAFAYHLAKKILDSNSVEYYAPLYSFDVSDVSFFIDTDYDTPISFGMPDGDTFVSDDKKKHKFLLIPNGIAEGTYTGSIRIRTKITFRLYYYTGNNSYWSINSSNAPTLSLPPSKNFFDNIYWLSSGKDICIEKAERVATTIKISATGNTDEDDVTFFDEPVSLTKN